MKKSLIVSVLSIAMIGSSMSAMADNNGWGNYRGDDRGHGQMRQDHGSRYDGRQYDRGYDRGYGRGYDRGYGRPNGEWHRDQRAYGRDHGPRWNQRYADAPRYGYGRVAYGWNRGDRVPNAYWHDRYYVNNWRSYPSLYEPPRGYRWLNVDGGFVLAAVATGVISAILLNR